MKSTISEKTYRAVYRLLDRVSPLSCDCGRLCGAACCTPEDESSDDDFEMGIYLLPGEERVFDENEDWLTWSWDFAEDYEFPDSWHGRVWFIRCNTPPFCPRKKRPLQCRSYPAAPHFTESGRLVLILSTEETPYSCPLMEKSMKLEEDFLHATFTAWSHLIRDPLIHDLVALDSENRRADNIPVSVIYDPGRC